MVKGRFTLEKSLSTATMLEEWNVPGKEQLS